ncbi:NADH-dependent dehydrogenase [Jeotgalibacillus malaysiensis]|uniref:NADH-dependent dehydrogenase n=1 Tax=Jeotgalibacillus malaysiensis TaxID=1508404 RepID=A0A0B5APF8_9BACL|nr:Gfo/Idh/MocA family oxidoreductase [Jeotgalibacillus malaysiensis]AJD89969.1 NADH-dependent dehydrogenase [Jeotgalibacillus malaysiensis]
MIKVAMLSRWHVHADDYIKEALHHPDIEVAAIWDEDRSRGEAWANEQGIPFIAELEDVLSDPDINGVIVDTPTTMHKEIIEQAAAHGKHIFSEKVLGLTEQECEEIFQAVDQAGVHLMLSLPRLSANYYLLGQQLADEGKLGKISSVRCRVAHDGAVPKDGGKGWLPPHFLKQEGTAGGSLIDLGAHPIYLANRLCGEPVEVKAMFQHVYRHEVDDQSAVLVKYESGQMAVLETGFVTSGLFQLEIHGSEGIYLVEDKTARYKNLETGGEWQEAILPEGLPSAMEQWVSQIEKGQMPFITRQDMRRLTKVNELAYQQD